jgi:hypothetical protein
LVRRTEPIGASAMSEPTAMSQVSGLLLCPAG